LNIISINVRLQTVIRAMHNPALNNHSWDKKINMDKLDEECSTHGREDKCAENSGSKSCREEVHDTRRPYIMREGGG
jgi:hypothetical protein